MSSYKLSNFLPLVPYGASLENLILHKDSFSESFCVIEKLRKRERHVILKGNILCCIAQVPLLVICGNHVSPYFISSCPKDIKSLAIQICDKVKYSLLKHFFTLFEHRIPVSCEYFENSYIIDSFY